MTQVSSLYLHVPFCAHLCNYCDFYKQLRISGEAQIESFYQSLLQAQKFHRELLADHGVTLAPLETVYLGGGTPSIWGVQGAEQFRSLGFTLAPDAEFTMEIDPGTWSEELFSAWEGVGLNRVSIGTQSLDPVFLKILDRAHSIEESEALLGYCQRRKFNFSLDFLLGVPYSREKGRDVIGELQRFLDFQPTHVSLYILNARSKYPHISAMPDDEFVREEYLQVSEFLRGAGFLHYEVSNFALPGFESRHNLRYWDSASVAALGPTGTGLLRLGPERGLRYKWKVSKPEAELEHLGPQELGLEEMYLSLRTNRGWRPSNLSPQLQGLFQHWVSQGYGQFDGERLVLGPAGFVILDSLMDDLFRLGF